MIHLNKKYSKAFTMVEVVVAVFILSLIAISLSWYFPYAQRMQLRAQADFRRQQAFARIKQELAMHFRSSLMDVQAFTVPVNLEDPEDPPPATWVRFYSTSVDDTVEFRWDEENNELLMIIGEFERVLARNITFAVFDLVGNTLGYTIHYQDPFDRVREDEDVLMGYISPRRFVVF